MPIEFYLADDTTLAGPLGLPKQAGADSDVETLHAWNDIGNDAGQERSNVLIVDTTESQSAANTFVRSGEPPQDESWGLARIVGYNNVGDPTWSVPSTDWTYLGAYNALPPIDRWPPNCAVYIEYKEHPPTSAQAVSWRRQLLAIYDEFAQAAPAALTRVLRGILHGVGDRTRSGLVRGFEVTATDTPDDYIHVAHGIALVGGLLFGKVATDHQLDQDDVTPAALTLGNSYIAGVTYGADGVTVTKGAQAVSPDRPSLPVGELFLRWVTVGYQAGPSVIEDTDLDGVTLYDRFMCLAGSGANVEIHAGQAIGGGTWRYSGVRQVVPVTLSATRYLWQLASGLWEISTTADAPPQRTALGPYWAVTCDGSGVTEIQDLRGYAARTVVLRLAGATPGSPGLVDDQLCEHDELALEQVVFRASDNGSGASGQTQADLLINGTTVYTSGADEQPVVAFDAPDEDLVHDDGVHEVTVIRKGDLLEFATTGHPTGGSPARLEMQLVCRVRQ